MQPCLNCGNAHDGPCPPLAHAAAPVSLDVNPPQSLRSGQILQGRYEILHVLGQGGMGTVFMARDMRLKGRSCVVKKLRDDFYREEDRQKARSFFEREMQVLSELRHPHIVQILDFFAEADDYYLVMEFVQGNNLYTMLQQEREGQPFPQRTVIGWVQQICEVLHYLHSQTPPVVYRDLKPSNVMVDVNNTIKLVDFGIARPWEDTGEHTNVVSAGYSPPEQYWGAVDPRSDIYALGATMHFLLTGHDPEALHVCSPKSVNAEVSEAIDAIVQQATAQELAERYQSVEEFMEALMHHDFIEAPTSPRSRIGEIITGVVILLLASIIFLVEPMLQADPDHKSEGARMVQTGTDNATIDNHGVTPAPGNAQPTQTPATPADLAVQLNDEKDLTDPEGLAPEAQQHAPARGGFKLPWQRK